MMTQNDTLLSIADRLARFSPLSTLVDAVVDKIAPRTTANACYGSNPVCSWSDAGTCRYACWADTSFCTRKTYSCVRIYKRTYVYGSACQYRCTTACDIFVQCLNKACTVDANCP